ncbi:hypothetical protein [Desulfovibrio litoralis]|uniref:Uncharacterized protein n=1 Tax=Desulfovibrio litoralis DSM 11393 TaxID=1121455 RepID=A0A1M7TD31_9BACT|nr:hypothetical protein [Desulfovibrio litoralis]SHN68625.1 hypothetical protein SAMN02745728_01862 [Desulfovibrio litoralis DSM 11393]
MPFLIFFLFLVIAIILYLAFFNETKDSAETFAAESAELQKTFALSIAEAEKKYQAITNTEDEELKTAKVQLALELSLAYRDLEKLGEKELAILDQRYEEIKQLGDDDDLNAVKVILAEDLIAIYTRAGANEALMEKAEQLYQEAKFFAKNNANFKESAMALVSIQLFGFYTSFGFINLEKQSPDKELVEKIERTYAEAKEFGFTQDTRQEEILSSLALLFFYNYIEKPDQIILKKAERIYEEIFNTQLEPEFIPIKEQAQEAIETLQKKYTSNISYDILKPIKR